MRQSKSEAAAKCRYPDTVEEANDSEKYKRYTYEVYDLIDTVAVALSVFVQPLIYCFHDIMILI